MTDAALMVIVPGVVVLALAVDVAAVIGWLRNVATQHFFT